MSDDIIAIADEVDKKKDLAAFANTNGGKVLREAARKDVLRLVNKLAYEHTSMDHIQLVGLCASLRASLSILQVLNGAEKNAKEALKDLEDALAE